MDTPSASSSVHIRRANIADARAIAELHAESWRAAYVEIMPQEWLDGLSVDELESRLREELANGRTTMLLACRESEFIGWTSLGPCRDEGSPPGLGEINALYLRPTVWGQGIGQQLWKAALKQLATDGFEQTVVWCLEENHRARRFYERMGAILNSGVSRMIGRNGVELAEIQYAICLEEVSKPIG